MCRAVPVTVGGSIAITLGLIRINPIEASSPTASPATAPAVLNRRQKIDSTITGRFADAATANASATRNATFAVGPSTMAIAIATAPTTNAEMRATSTSSPGLRSTAVVDHVGPEVVRERSRRADRQSGDHRQNRGKSDRRDEREEDVPRPERWPAAARSCSCRRAS